MKTTTIKTETRGRKFNMAKFAISRAWEIARNATVAHNTNPIDVALKGLVKPSEYFAESLKLGWKEAKAKAAKDTSIEAYKLHKVPKKNQKSILNAIDMLVMAKAAIGETPKRLEIAETIFDARYTTVSARSTNRHIRNALPMATDTGIVESEFVTESSTYAIAAID